VAFREAGRFGVDAGTAGFLDAHVFAALSDHVFEENAYDDLLAPSLATAGAAAALVPFEGSMFFACRSGDGDGVYPVFVGSDAAGTPVAVLVSF
jgi:hypothetical protein